MSAFLFPETWKLVFTFQWSLRFHFPDFIFFSFFASPQKYAALCHSASHLLFVGAVQVPGLFFTWFSQGPFFLDKEIEDCKPALDLDFFLDLDLFLVLQTIRIETFQLIIFSLLIGQWTTSLPQYASFLSFGSLLFRILLLGRVYHFVAVP